MIKIVRHTEGDTRVAKEIPTFVDFKIANEDHVADVRNLAAFFANELKNRVIHHDWTKLEEPYRSLFYRDFCAVLEGRMKSFCDGGWFKQHVGTLERHHLKERCPYDVNLFDVIEMLCDCVAAGMARRGDVYDVEISSDVLQKAVKNTVDMLKNEIEVIDQR